MITFAGEVHPLAEQWPMMPDDELAALAADIRANGLQQSLAIDSQGRLVDGRNRLAACQIARVEPSYIVADDESVAAYIDSANLHRRHLTREQKRVILATRIKAAPQLSDRQHADRVGVSPSTAGDVRRDLEDTGQLSKLDSRTGADGRVRSVRVEDTGRARDLHPRPAPPAAPGPRRRPLPDAFFAVSHDLGRMAKSLHNLTTDDRWSRNVEQVTRYRNDLLATRDLIDQVLAAMPNNSPEG